MLAIGNPHSTEHGSVKLEMVHHLPHSKNLYAEDNKIVNRHITEANLSMQYSKTFVKSKCYQKKRGAGLALNYQFAGPASWNQDIKYTMNFLVNRKWTGNTGFYMQAFLNHHCE